MQALQAASRRTIIGCVFVVLAAIATMFIYVYPLQAYYEQKDIEQTEKTKLEKLKDANEELKEQKKGLSSDEEIERIAREDYRLIRPGEEAYIVTEQN